MINWVKTYWAMAMSAFIAGIAGCVSNDSPDSDIVIDSETNSDSDHDAGQTGTDNTPGPDQCVFYVNKNAISVSPDGRTWATAFTVIQGGIDAAYAAINGSAGIDSDTGTDTDTDTDTDNDCDLVSNCDTDTEDEPPETTCDVWVAGGVYEFPDCSDLGVWLRPGVSVYGGFAGSETSLEDRDLITHPTVIDGAGVVGTVIAGASFAIFDGFTVEHGGSGGNCTDGVLSGGAIVNRQASPTVRNCIFHYNYSLEGGAVGNYDSAPLFENCIFANNLAGIAPNNFIGQGGAVFNQQSNPTFVNCTFFGNIADVAGGAMYSDEESAPTIVSSIIWDNLIEGPAIITYSDVQGGWPGEGNIDLAPQLHDPENGDLTLLSSLSPCVDAADGSQSPETDGLGRPRFDDPLATNTGKGPPWADMGALEHSYESCADNSYQQCGADGNVHWFDICGQEGEVVETCPTTNAFCYEPDAIAAACVCTHHWSGDNCDVCPGNWDAAQECEACNTGNFDPEKDCGGCLGGWNGSGCDQLCVRHVDINAPVGGDGLSWSTAFDQVQEGIDAARDAAMSDSADGSCQVWVAEGVYYLYVSSQEDTVQLQAGVYVYGGFEGSETALTERDFRAHPTVLDGHEGPLMASQVIHVVVGSDDALLDGFTVTGAADGGLLSWGTSPTVRNSAIVGNTGGGIYGSGQFIDCIIANNQGGDGAFFSGHGEKTSLVSGCAITGNSYKISVCGPVVIENSTIAGNSFGINVWWPVEGCVVGEALEMRNTIVWGNDEPSSIVFEDANISHSLVDGIPSGNGNLNVDPLFVDAAAGDYHLQKGSPCIDAADGTTTSERDLDGNPRVDDPNAPNVGIGPPWVDMGAYEGQP